MCSKVSSASKRATKPISVADTSAINWAHMHEVEHFVQFYEQPDYLFDSVSEYLAAGLKSNSACIVLAATPHLQEIEHRLQTQGLDIEAARKQGQYFSFAGQETLQKLLVNGHIDRNVFFDIVGQTVQAAKRRYPQLRIFGELVGLLCEQGEYTQAHALESLWNELSAQDPFALFCGYPMSAFSNHAHAEAFAQVCDSHSRVIPSEQYSSLEDGANRMQVIGKLQQKAHALEQEVALRRDAEAQLAAREKELSDFLENAAEPLHQIDAMGTIRWANAAELKLLGYAAHEYLGRHFGDFNVDRQQADHIFKKMLAGATVRDELAQLRRKDGSIKDVLLTSNAYFENGKFIYSRGIMRDVTLRRQMEQALYAAAEANRETQTELLQLNEILEHLVRERTDELKRSELQFSRLVAGVADYAIYLLDVNGNVSSWNTGATRIKGYAQEEIVGQHFSVFYTDEDRQRGIPQLALETARRTGKYESEAWRVRKDGSLFWASVLIDAIHTPNGELLGFAKVTRDMTERRAMEEALRQSQKMEAIGQLTGGVAHDFNNLLTVIIGNLETLTRRLPTAAPGVSRAIDLAMRGAQRAALLTQQLLAFSRKQPLSPKPTDVNQLVVSMSDLLRRSLGENIRIETALAGGLWRTEIDSHQLENALLNLAVNARDAMHSHGGTLAIETANVCIDKLADISGGELPRGDYVSIRVADTGAGMSETVMTRAFEPFFTTKPMGQGTGLGLSQVYGFIKQSGGYIKLYSEIGNGTTVRIYLPRLLAGANEEIEMPASTPLPRGNDYETILVVEDDHDVRSYSIESLRELGFTVLEASDAYSALQLIDQHPEVQLLFTDVGLPGIDGKELAEQARARRPQLRVLFTSGYAQQAMGHQGRLEPGVELLSKPFTRAQLAVRVREILDTAAPAGRQASVLIVDDEALVRNFLADTLKDMGFHVVEADCVAAALRAARSVEPLSVALVDLGLPDRSGLELIDELKILRPHLPVLIASGYSDMVQRDASEQQAGRQPQYLPKPYNAAAVSRALHELGIRIPKQLLN